MSFNVPPPKNEPVLSYAPNTVERAALQTELDRRLRARIDAPMWIAGHAITSSDLRKMSPPHKHAHNLGAAHFGEAKHVRAAIDAALKAKRDWENMPFEERAAIFLKAADLLAGPYLSLIHISLDPFGHGDDPLGEPRCHPLHRRLQAGEASTFREHVERCV